MEDSVGNKCMKWLLFTFNLLFFIFGGLLLGLGIWVVVDGDLFLTAISPDSIMFHAVYILIAVGVALMIVSLFGFVGAVKENKCMLGTFFALVLIIFSVEIVGGILAFVLFPNTKDQIVESMQTYRYNRSEEEEHVVSDAWDFMQTFFACCGFNSTDNWKYFSNGTFPADDGAPFPDSCCERTDINLDGEIRNKSACMRKENFYYTVPCEQKIEKYFWSIGGVSLGILVIELFGMIFSCCLYRAISKEATNPSRKS